MEHQSKVDGQSKDATNPSKTGGTDLRKVTYINTLGERISQEASSPGSTVPHETSKLSRYVQQSTQQTLWNGANFITSKDFDDIVEISIGKNATKFRVHAYKLSQASNFFKAACSSLWECGRTRTITLDDQDPGIFAIFISWLLNETLNKTDSFVELALEGEARKSSLMQQWTQLCYCYFLGDFLQSDGFKNQVVDYLLVNKRLQAEELKVISGTKPRDIKLVWANTVACSSLRRLILDHNMVSGCTKLLETQAPCTEFHEYLCEFMALCVERRKQGKKGMKPWQQDICFYHERQARLTPCEAEG
jgi:hypothetical protein